MRARLESVVRVLCVYSALMCSFSIASHFYLFSTGEITVVGLPEALLALFGLGFVVVTSLLVLILQRKWKKTGGGEIRGRRMRLGTVVQVLSIYSTLILSYSIGGNLYLFFTSKAQVMELSGALFALLVLAPVIIMSILAFSYSREVHTAQ